MPSLLSLCRCGCPNHARLRCLFDLEDSVLRISHRARPNSGQSDGSPAQGETPQMGSMEGGRGSASMDTFTCVLPTLVSQGGKPLLCPRTSPRQLRTDLLTHPQPWTQPLPTKGPPKWVRNKLTSTLPRGPSQTQLCQRLSDICGCFAACLFTTETGQQQQGFFASGDFK